MRANRPVLGRDMGLYRAGMFPIELKFRRAALADVAAVVELVHGAYRGEASRAGWTTEADLLDGQRTDADEVAALIAGRSTRIVLAMTTRELVGSLLLHGAQDVMELGMIAVRPVWQMRGVGRALLAHAERIAQNEAPGCVLRMNVIGQRPELLAWYARRGYLPTGQHKPFPYGQPRFGLPRRADLYFEVLEKRLAPLQP
jgi:GNAT superfamily N-acetyltransferase